MGEFLLYWISKSPLDQGLTLLFLGAFIGLVGFIIIKVVANLKKRKLSPTATMTPDGLKLGFSSDEAGTAPQKEDLTPMEQKLINFFEARNKKQEDEIAELRDEISKLKYELQNMQVQIGIKNKTDEDNKKNLIPFNQHPVFTNLKTSIERSIDFPNINNEEYKRKVYLGKIFIQECRSPILCSTFKDFINTLEAIKNDTEKINFMFTLPDVLYSAIDAYSEAAFKKELIFNNICVVGIPVCFVDKYKQFTRPHVDLLVNKIKSVLYSSFYRTWQLKLIMILDVMDTVFSLVTHELINTINTLNGEVDKEIDRKIKEAKCS
jgi:uncharacterized coiled-coil protein SlyX